MKSVSKIILLVILLSLSVASQAHASWLSRILGGHHYKIHHKHRHKSTSKPVPSTPTPTPTPPPMNVK